MPGLGTDHGDTVPGRESHARGGQSAMANETRPSPQWARDPTGRHDYRYWDGTQWTGHVINGGPLPTAPPDDGEAPPTYGDSTYSTPAGSYGRSSPAYSGPVQ